jgi:hypothetical protein
LNWRPFLIILILYKKYKNSEKEEVPKPSWFAQTNFFKYVKLVFVTRVNLRPWTAIWYVPLILSSLGSFTIGPVIMAAIYPPLPLEKMQTQEGIIQSIIDRKKMDGLLVLKTKNNEDKEFAIENVSEEEPTALRNKEVKIWYSRGFSSLYTIDNIVYEITVNGKSIREYPYNYKRVLEVNKSFQNFAKYCFYTVLFSILMMWIPNRNELPIHRLNRMKLHKKNKGMK